MGTALQRKNALVTGASRGLGRGIALAIADEGGNVAVAYKERHDLAESVVGEIRRRGVRSEFFSADISNNGEAIEMFADAVEFLGSLDILVCNAGVTISRLISRTTEDDWDFITDVNLGGAATLCKEAVIEMKKNGGGHIVLISSFSAVSGREGQSAYSASKAALIGFGKSLAAEVAANDIKVNIVLPGYMPTDMGKGAAGAAEAAIEDNLLKRLNDTAEVAAFVAHLVTMDNVSGQVFNLDSRLYREF